MGNCARCHRTLAAGEGRPVAVVFKLLAALSLAGLHAGQWAWTALSENYCAPCRRRLSLLSLLAATIVLALVIYGFIWAFRKGLFHL